MIILQNNMTSFIFYKHLRFVNKYENEHLQSYSRQCLLFLHFLADLLNLCRVTHNGCLGLADVKHWRYVLLTHSFEVVYRDLGDLADDLSVLTKAGKIKLEWSQIHLFTKNDWHTWHNAALRRSLVYKDYSITWI